MRLSQKKEIDYVVKQIPPDKAPGPLMGSWPLYSKKKCWFIVAHDSYELCKAFFNADLNIQSKYSSFVTLVKKKIMISDLSPS